jgi:hypothetical protein
MPPTLARGYLVELLRIVKPGGGLIFQLPSHYADNYLHPERDDGPVPMHARQADLVLTHWPEQLPAGATSKVRVAITNLSDRTWFQTDCSVLNVGNHWIASDASIAAWDDGRGRLPGRILAGETVEVEVMVTAPARPGIYRLAVDLVQESVGWFRTGAGPRGCNPSARGCHVVVTEAQAAPTTSYSSSADRGLFDDLISEEYFQATPFEMHGIPRREIEALLAERGALLLGADEYITEWHSFTYYVQLPN